MPVKGYDSVNLPSALYDKVKRLVKKQEGLGYRSVTEFVADSVRRRTEEIEKRELCKKRLKQQLEELNPKTTELIKEALREQRNSRGENNRKC
jgi:Arc/MetJ-type ribon-helix-helix transcriptional regulator